jgi:hypothetical protein
VEVFEVMRNRTLYTVAAIFLLACFCYGQGVPVPALRTPVGDDVSVGYMLVVKDSGLNLGNGVEFKSTHYLTRHIGFSAEAEAMQVTPRWNLSEIAARGGATYRFNIGANFQPFVQALAGYASVTATSYFGPGKHTKVGGSLLGGAGADVRVRGPLFARITADVVDNWDAKTRFVRGTAGIAYHFGDRVER